VPESITVSGAASINSGEAAQFASDVSGSNAGLRFHWEFGDGATSEEAAPAHAYQAPGDYDVVLTVTNEDGDSRSASFKVSVRRFAIVQDATCSTGARAGWCWQRPLPTGNWILDISFVDASNGWAVGEAGQILKTSDGGTSWVAQASNVDSRLTQVQFVDASVGWAVGDNNLVFRTTDGGAHWTRQAAEAGDYPGYGFKLAVVDAMRAVLISNSYGASYTLDGGQSWTATSMNPGKVTPQGTLWSMNSSTLTKATHLGADAAVLSYSTNQYLEFFSMGDEQHGLLTVRNWLTMDQTLLRTVDGGESWQAHATSGLPTPVSRLEMTGPNSAWAVADDGLYRSGNGGGVWRSVVLPSDAYAYELYSMTTLDSRTLWFRHGNGYYLTTDGGVHWSMQQVSSEYFYPSSLRRAGGATWLQYDGRTYRSIDGGVSWEQVFGNEADESDGSLTAAWFFDARNGLAIGRDGWLLETANGGRTWERRMLTNSVSYSFGRLQFNSASTGWMSGELGVSKTTDGGKTWWLPVTDLLFSNILDFNFIDADQGWALANADAVYRTIDGGSSWARVGSLPQHASAMQFIDSQTGVAVGYQGRIWRTADGGISWSQRPTGVAGDLMRVAFVDATTAWAVGGSGTVVKTTDGGLTWSQVPVPTDAWLHDVRFVDSQRGWIVGQGGTVLSTDDGGRTWAVQDSGTSRNLYGAFFLDAFTGWLVGDGSAVLATATGGY
jgi:photosystem II stability/assembly factor-like uncharacterized protein